MTTLPTTVGAETLRLVLAIGGEIDALKDDMVNFRVSLEASRQQASSLRRLGERMRSEIEALAASLGRIERRLDNVEVTK